jgi:AsnC-type helix-turn-helix domain
LGRLRRPRIDDRHAVRSAAQAAAGPDHARENPRGTTLADMDEGIDEIDIALLDAMHLQPRVSFEDLARVLDVSAVTAARRWHRLSQDGLALAWVSSAPRRRLGTCGALFEAEAHPGRRRPLPMN